MARPVNSTSAAAKLRAQLDKTFDDMDVDADGRVSQEEFARFIEMNPRGWPLAELMQGLDAAKKKQMMQFWFRKLDLGAEGTFDKGEFYGFYQAMQTSGFQEKTYAEFLLSLFDLDFDMNLSRPEVEQMLQVLLGHKPSHHLVTKVMASSNRSDGTVDKAALERLLHDVHCNFGALEKSSHGSGGDLVLVAVGVAVVGVAAFVAYKVLTRHR